jgi:hypothetical protein
MYESYIYENEDVSILIGSSDNVEILDKVKKKLYFAKIKETIMVDRIIESLNRKAKP